VHDRCALGAADVDDARLAALVADALGVASVELLSSRAEVVAYDIEAFTTAGRYRVTGRARHAGGESGFAFFVKVLQSWGRTAAFAFVPEALREFALAAFPFEAEARVYRSDLAHRLPPGLVMPRAYAALDLDAESTVLWLEDVPVAPTCWDRAGLARAAHLLGRLAASPQVRPVATVADPQQLRTPRGYAEGRLALQVVPALHDPDVWRHPLVAGAFDDTLRRDLVAAADALPAVVDELEALPQGAAHGDACTRNLLVATDRPELVLIDFGFWGPAALGFDLGQLLLGEVQLGERSATALAADEDACLAAYVAGLRAEGCAVDVAPVRRGHALQMLLFSALPSLPFELLDAEPTPAGAAVTRERAAAARFVLDLVEASRPTC
jgi:Choline/ethanolamine kinase